MKLSVYVPQDLEEPLRARAASEGLTPSLYVQAVVREDIKSHGQQWSDEFKALAGSWQDERSTEEIIRDIEENRSSVERDALL